MSGMSYDALMKPGQIIKVIKRLQTPATFFTDLLGTSPYKSSPIKVVDTRTFGYDIYAATRTLAGLAAPNQPPIAQGRKPIGQGMATLFRFHPSIQIMDHEVFASRMLGSFGLNTEVDQMGRNYIRMQLEHIKATIDNSIEWMNVRMLQGGFGMKVQSDGYRLCEVTDPDRIHTVSSNVPAEHLGNIDGILTGGSWDDAASDLFSQLSDLSIIASRVSGLPIRHIVLNGKTAAPLFINNKLSQAGGSSFTVFERLTNRPVAPDTPLTSGQYTVVFRALPQYIFHIYNEGLVTADVIPDEKNQIDDANWKMLIPDDYAFFLPEGNSFAGYATGREIVQEATHLPAKVVSGFHAWNTRAIDPPRFENKFLLNYVPLLMQPRAVFYGKVNY